MVPLIGLNQENTMSLIFEIDEIPEEGMKIEVSEKAEHFKIDPIEGVLNQDVVVSGILKKADNDVYFSGAVSTVWSVNCSRCLEPILNRVETDMTADYVPKGNFPESNTDMELNEADIDVEYYTENKIDLTQSVYDQIMLSVPLATLCSETCKGLCSQCGTNLNIESCECGGEDSGDPRLAVLKNLKNQLE